MIMFFPRAKLRRLAAMAIPLFFAAWALQPLHAADEYKLGPGDQVLVTVYDSPELTTQERVNQGGEIRFPFLGEVQVGGLTEIQAEAELERLMEQRGIVREPQMNILIQEYRSKPVAVLGEVTQPGEYYLIHQTKIIDILAQAGWVTDAAANYVSLVKTRGGQQAKEKIYLEDLFAAPRDENARLSAGDTIYVPRMDVFYIQGAVNQPGAYRLERDMTVMQAISVGGGVTDVGNREAVTVTRQLGSAGDTSTLELEPTDILLPDDVIYIGESLF